jgi:hypothetical protein
MIRKKILKVDETDFWQDGIGKLKDEMESTIVKVLYRCQWLKTLTIGAKTIGTNQQFPL